jgi:membrane protein
MNFFKKTFITQPMLPNFFLTILVNGIVIYITLMLMSLLLFKFLIYNNIELVMVTMINLVLFFYFIRVSAQTDREELGNIFQQLKRPAIIFSKKKFINILICFLYYISIGLLIVEDFKVININLHLIEIFILNVKTIVTIIIGLLICLVVLFLFRFVYQLIGISPWIVIGFSSILIIFSSLIGIENSPLSWTFLMLIFGTITTQFTSIDIKYFFPEKYRDKIDNNEKIKEKLSRIKYSTIIYIPILYISLLFSEKISVSNNFIYLVNKMTSSHYEEASQEFFSIYTFFSGILKLIFITLGWIVFIEYKDIFLTKVTRSLIGKVKEIENLSISNGKYYKIRCSKRKWNIDKSVFLLKKQNSSTENESQKIRDKFILSKESWLSLNTNRSIKVISNDIVKVDNDYFIHNESNILNKFEKIDKRTRKIILGQLDLTVLIIVSMFFSVLVLSNLLLDVDMKKVPNGVFYYNNSGQTTDRIYFFEDKISHVKDNIQYFNSTRSLKKVFPIVTNYKYDKVSMTIKDEKHNIVGELNKMTKIIDMKDEDGNKKTYIEIK